MDFFTNFLVIKSNYLLSTFNLVGKVKLFDLMKLWPSCNRSANHCVCFQPFFIYMILRSLPTSFSFNLNGHSRLQLSTGDIFWRTLICYQHLIFLCIGSVRVAQLFLYHNLAQHLKPFPINTEHGAWIKPCTFLKVVRCLVS